MTYLDLVLTSLLQGWILIWPFSGDILLPHLFPVIAAPNIGPVVLGAGSLGATLALILLLNGDIQSIGRSAWAAAKRRQDGSARLLIALSLAALPLALRDGLAVTPLPLPLWTVALLMLLSGAALLLADRFGVTVRDMHHVSIPAYGTLGLLLAAGTWIDMAPQLTAIIIARLMGCERDQAARIALLLLLPHLLTAIWVWQLGDAQTPMLESALMVLLSGLTTLLAGRFLLGWLERRSLALPALLQMATGIVLVLSVTGFGR